MMKANIHRRILGNHQTENNVTEKQQKAIYDLVYKYSIGDYVYDVRGSLPIDKHDGSSWEHPDVVRFGECCVILKEMAGEKHA